jgi:hypothetical protein
MRDATTRTELFEASAQLARVLAAADSAGGWQPLRDIILAGLEAGGIRAGSDPKRYAELPECWRRSRLPPIAMPTACEIRPADEDGTSCPSLRAGGRRGRAASSPPSP